MRSLNRGLIVIALTGVVLGCADESAEEVNAVSQAAQAACAVWSCQINQCQQDPAIYGACCIQAASTEYPATPNPSCDAPPPPGYPSWCVIGSPKLSCINHPFENPLNPYAPCLDLPFIGDTGLYYDECNDWEPEWP